MIVPPEMEARSPVDQDDTHYDIGFRYKDNDEYELRIGLYPKTFLAKMDDAQDGIEKRRTLEMISMVTGMNIAQSDKIQPNIRFYPDQAVKDEFNADIGTTTSVSGNSRFSGNFKIVMINSFYKKGRNYVVVYHLFRNSQVLKDMAASGKLLKTFHCVKFE